ncbi:beta-ketoacyl synthase N-terminal-like domain-containing protein [Flavobacterium sp. DG1-102-2]|uniref:beta-ketoacyl synthase N-terminal-like domain-containing protein n=1 Tax=Flavobacterium sp. DG1-102-2 TaxID=3081663 RepID=UPI002948DB40|nr:beta-ketoacyl synthase N-terminal-like domain-containing protein [Flavobacterium sp. DG1-102-2]MDV6169270.1 beta-ketoacyl synthase N-terminal-like domain-containing protein [Flavobacterium sp. DG1-102-2]
MELKNVYITHTNCITPLGFDVAANVQAIAEGNTGITQQSGMLPEPFYAGVIDNDALTTAFAAISDKKYTRLEKMMLLALQPMVQKSGVQLDSKTALLLSTTKGNITSLPNEGNLPDEVYLQGLAKNIAGFFGFTTMPIVVSNACVSGIMAVSVAKRLIQSGLYDNVFIVAGDEVSEFVLSGFNSFQAMSSVPCKPYSADRSGVTLGEAAAAVLVTKDLAEAKAKITGDGSINDANHISGPSRTGEGLFRSIEIALKESGVGPEKIDYISAHGTATPFNDEMEAIAFNRLGLENVPVNSFKGYYGHTLGASGLLETVIALESMAQNKVFTSLGYDEPGVSQPINVITKNEHRQINYFLKTASGFGGCNTAVVFEKTGNGR